MLAKSSTSAIGIILPLIVTILLPLAAMRVRSQELMWSASYGGAYSEEGYACHQTDDGGYVALGSTYSFGLGDFDIYLLKMNAMGDTLYTRTYGGTGTDYGRDIQQTFDGGFVIAGSTTSFGNGKRDAYVVRTDETGAVLWERTYGGGENDDCWSVRQTPDSGYILCGSTDSFGPGYSDIYLLKLDAAGDTIWTRAYGGEGGDRGQAARRTPDSCYIIVGSTGSFGEGYSCMYVIKVDADGDTLWTTTYGGLKADFGYSVELALDGGYIFAGCSGSFTSMYSDAYLVKTDPDGFLEWENTYGGDRDDRAYSVSPTVDGGYVLTGITQSFGAGGFDVYVVKVDPVGDTLWSSTYGGTESDLSRVIIQNGENDLFVVGHSYSYTSAGSDIYLLKISGESSTPVEEPVDNILLPAGIELAQNYPNPFNNATTIPFTLPRRMQVELTIYNVLGQVVRHWRLGSVGAGSTCVFWDGQTGSGEESASGVYFYSITSRAFRQTKKMVLLK